MAMLCCTPVPLVVMSDCKPHPVPIATVLPQYKLLRAISKTRVPLISRRAPVRLDLGMSRLTLVQLKKLLVHCRFAQAHRPRGLAISTLPPAPAPAPILVVETLLF
jgi:hypothetical protein